MPITTAITSYATPSGADLLLRMDEAIPSPWDEILRRYGKLVSTTVRSFRLQDADTLDAVQRTWLRLAENIHQVRHPERLGGWLATTARRECLRILREAKPAPDLTCVMPETVADPSAGPEQRVTDVDTAQTLWKLVDALPLRRRILLRALFADNPLPYAEVARLTGISPGAIGPTRARALRQLRGMIEQQEPAGSPAIRPQSPRYRPPPGSAHPTTSLGADGSQASLWRRAG
jgi:RNA polymerase sigma factor (sigma-70 family)